jgi:O-antigen/teichoic acid export membrane protein
MKAGRIRRLILSYATSGLSKSVAAIVQIIALPIVAESLGREYFGALMVLGAMGAAFCVPARGVPPSLSIAIAHCRGADDSEGISPQIWGAALVSVTLGALALVVAACLLALFGMNQLLGTADNHTHEYAVTAVAFLSLIVSTYGFAWVEGLRTGFEENHVNNLFSLLGSGLALVGIALARVFAPTVAAYFLAIYVVYPFVQLGNLLLALRSLPSGSRGNSFTAAWSIGRRALSWSIAQLGVVLNWQGTVWLAAHTAGMTAGGLVGGVVRLFQILSSLSLTLITPVLPTLRHSLVAGDDSWSLRALRLTVTLICIAVLIMGALFALLGPMVLQAWLHLDFDVPRVVFAGFGILAIASMLPQLFYLVLMAIGSSKAASLNLLLGGVCGTLAGAFAIGRFGLAGLILGQGLGMLFLACIPNSRLVLAKLSRPTPALNAKAVP